MILTSIATTAAILILSTVTVSSAQGDTGTEWEKLHKETIELFRAEKYEQAVLTAKNALELAEKIWGPNHLHVATSLNKLAELYIIQEQYPMAESLCKRAMEIREKALSPEHPDMAESLNTLAWFYESQEQYVQAESLYKRAVEIREKTLGPKHPDLAESINNLALIYGYQGQHTQAEPLFKRSLEIREKALGPNHPDVAESLMSLATLYKKQSLYTQAEPLYRRAVAIRDKSLPPDHPAIVRGINSLAMLYMNQNLYAQAEPLYKRALTIREKFLGKDDPELAAAINNLAIVHFKQKQYAQAELLFKHSMEIMEKSLGPNHPDVAANLNSLAVIYDLQGEYAQAEPLYKRALMIREKAFGHEHPVVAEIRGGLIDMYVKLKRFKDAEALMKSATSPGINDNDSINWAEVSAGSAAGDYTINGKSIELTHVYALSQPNFFEESKKDIAVLLTKAPVPDGTLKNISRLQDVSQDMHEWVLFLIDESGRPIHEWIDHPSLGEIRLTSSGITYAKFIQKTFNEDIIEGAFITKVEEEFPTKHKYKINVQFNVAVLKAKRPEPLPDAKTGQKLPEDGEEPGKAYMDFLKAIQEKNIAVIRSMSPPKIAKKSDSELLMIIEFLAGMTPKDLKITEGYIKGDAAVLYVIGTEDGEQQYGTIPLNKEGKHWIVGEQKWRNKPQSNK